MITIWHNPRCTKSRQALALLETKGRDITIRKYLEDSPSEAELKDVQTMLGLPALAMMRVKEPLFKELGLAKDAPDAELIAAMAAHPKLIERPVILHAGRAVIGRPTEAIETLF